MRKFKSLMAVIVSIAMIISVQLPAAAEGTSSISTDAKICESLGMLIGEGDGLTEDYLKETPTRIQAALLYLRLKGLDKEALTFNSTSNFDDVDKAKWAVNIMGYLKAHPELGMVGEGNNKFSPDTYITAQGYYKILLEALNYKTNVDFEWDSTLSFARAKGLYKAANESKFTLDNLATATVEALKTPLKGEATTLAGSLVKSGKFTGAQSEALNAAGISLENLSFELSAKSASSLLVKFNTKVSDVFKISFAVSRDSVTLGSFMGFWNSDSTELTISQNTNLDPGNYMVTISYDNTPMGTKTVPVEAEKVASLELTPKAIILTSDVKGEVNYRALNQYGEDVSNSALVQNITWSSTADSITVNASSNKLIITKDGTVGVSQLKDVDYIVVTGYDSSWKTAVSEQLPVSDGYGLVKDIKFIKVYNKDGKTEITVDTEDKFYIDYEAYDAEGNKIDSYALLSNIGTFGLYSNNENIQAHVVRDPDNLSRALIEIDRHIEVGTAEITGIAVTASKSSAISVEVKKGASLDKFIIESPANGAAVNEKVEIPFKAYDQNGNPLEKYNDINGKIVIIVDDSYHSVVVGERASDGRYVLTGMFSYAKKYNIKVVTIDSGTSSDLTLEVSPAAVPTTISAVNRDVIYNAIVKNGKILADFVNNPAFTVLDQNDREFNMKDVNYVGGYYYYINAVPADKTKVGIDGTYSIAYKDTEITLVGGATKGVTTVTFELCRDKDPNPSNGKEVIDVKDVSITNVDSDDIVGYEFVPIDTLYANPNIDQTETYATMQAKNPQYAAYAADIKLYGTLSNGNKVALNPKVGVGNDILNLTVTDTNKFSVDLTNKKILAKSIGDDNEATDKLVATMQGANSSIQTVAIDIKSTKSVPVAQSIEAVLAQGSAITRSGDTFTCSASVFSSSVMGRELRKYNAVGNNTATSEIVFVLIDQYGNNALTPSYFALTKTQGSGSVSINATTGLLSGSASSGDQYIITAVTSSGLTKAITINIQ